MLDVKWYTQRTLPRRGGSRHGKVAEADLAVVQQAEWQLGPMCRSELELAGDTTSVTCSMSSALQFLYWLHRNRPKE